MYELCTAISASNEKFEALNVKSIVSIPLELLSGFPFDIMDFKVLHQYRGLLHFQSAQY